MRNTMRRIAAPEKASPQPMTQEVDAATIEEAVMLLSDKELLLLLAGRRTSAC